MFYRLLTMNEVVEIKPRFVVIFQTFRKFTAPSAKFSKLSFDTSARDTLFRHHNHHQQQLHLPRQDQVLLAQLQSGHCHKFVAYQSSAICRSTWNHTDQNTGSRISQPQPTGDSHSLMNQLTFRSFI